MEQISLDFGRPQRIYSVSELNAAIRSILDKEFRDIWVAGEISGVKLAASGHYYFTLKDESAQLRCVSFRQYARLLRFKPQEGIAVLARGRIDVYEPRGEYQLLVEVLEPQGYGALQLAFEQLKQKLAAEGLFDPARKRPLPRLPSRIGIVTSPTGAVIRDMLQILGRRLPGLHIRIYPAQVQGAGSIEEVIEGIEWFSQSGWPEVIIVARGGGSLEDLWTFNEEPVARAIARSAVPVISAIGHETDVTISDFVADLRAPTPSAAAELVVPTREQLLEQVESLRTRLEKEMRFRLAGAARRLHEVGAEGALAAFERSLGRRMQRVDELEGRLRHEIQALRQVWNARRLELDDRLRARDPRIRLASAWRRLEAAVGQLCSRTEARLSSSRARLEALSGRLAALSPLGILERGYAIVLDESGRTVKNAADVQVKSVIEARLARGRLRARVTRSIPDGSSELPS